LLTKSETVGNRMVNFRRNPL